MSRNEKIGLGALIAIFVLFVAILIATVRPFSNTIRSPEKSVFVEQRLINLQKSK